MRRHSASIDILGLTFRQKALAVQLGGTMLQETCPTLWA